MSCSSLKPRPEPQTGKADGIIFEVFSCTFVREWPQDQATATLHSALSHEGGQPLHGCAPGVFGVVGSSSTVSTL